MVVMTQCVYVCACTRTHVRACVCETEYTAEEGRIYLLKNNLSQLTVNDLAKSLLEGPCEACTW